jgi:ribosomal protein S18
MEDDDHYMDHPHTNSLIFNIKKKKRKKEKKKKYKIKIFKYTLNPSKITQTVSEKNKINHSETIPYDEHCPSLQTQIYH